MVPSYKEEVIKIFGSIPEYEDIYKNKKQFVSSITGLYLLFKNDKVVYVGQSKNIFARLVAHQSEKDFNGYYIYECSIEKAKALEIYFIINFNPEYNSTMPQNIRYKSLSLLNSTRPPAYFKKIKALIKRKKLTPVFLNNYDTLEIESLLTKESTCE